MEVVEPETCIIHGEQFVGNQRLLDLVLANDVREVKRMTKAADVDLNAIFQCWPNIHLKLSSRTPLRY